MSDHGTRELVAEMLAEDEERADFFEGQLDVIQRSGSRTTSPGTSEATDEHVPA